MSELRDFFPSARAIADRTHAHATLDISAECGHVVLVTDTAVVAAHTHADRCTGALSVADIAPRTSRFVARRSQPSEDASSLEVRARDAHLRCYRAACWSPCGLAAAGRSAAPLLAVCGGVTCDARVLRPPALAEGTCPPWEVVATPSEALVRHHTRRWTAQPEEEEEEEEECDAAPSKPQRKRRKTSAAAAAAAAASSATQSPPEETQPQTQERARETEQLDETDQLAAALLERLGAPKEDEDEAETGQLTRMETTVAARVHAVLPVAAAWSQIATTGTGDRVALLAVASRRTVALHAFEAARTSSPGATTAERPQCRELAVLDLDDVDDDNNTTDITCLAFSPPHATTQQQPLLVQDMVLALGTSNGTVVLVELGADGTQPTVRAVVRAQSSLNRFVAAAQFVQPHTLVLVSGRALCALSTSTNKQCTMQLASCGTSLAYSRASERLCVGTIAGAVEQFLLRTDDEEQAPVLERGAVLACDDPVVGVACSPTGGLLYCMVQPRYIRAMPSVRVYALGDSTKTLTYTVLAANSRVAAPGYIDNLALMLSRSNTEQVAALLAKLDADIAAVDSTEKPRLISLKFVVLCQDQQVRREEGVSELLARCATELLCAHSRKFLEGAVAHAKPELLAPVELCSLSRHAQLLRTHGKEPEDVKVAASAEEMLARRNKQYGLDQHCPICNSVIVNFCEESGEGGAGQRCACERGHWFAQCPVARVVIAPDTHVRHCCCCGTSIALFDPPLFTWHPQPLCPFCGSVPV